MGPSGNTDPLCTSAWFQPVCIPVTAEMAIGGEGEPAWLSIKLCQTETSRAISLAGEATLDKPEFGKFGFFKKKEKQRVKHFYLGERISDSSND